MTLRPSVSSINSCRHAGQLRLSVRIASARGRSRPSHRTKLTVMAMYFSVLDQVSTTVKWTSNTDVPIGVEPAPPRQHLTCYTSKPRYSFKPSILHPSIQTGWESAHPICLVVGKRAVTLVTLFCHGLSSLVWFNVCFSFFLSVLLLRWTASSLPRSAGSKSSSLPASARSGLSAMLCVDGSALERHGDCPVQSIVHVFDFSYSIDINLNGSFLIVVFFY